MTHPNNYNLTTETIEEITKNGLEAVPELMRVLINNVMQVERSKYIQAGDYERTEDRKDHANGYKPKTVRTRLGEITFAVPQVREGGLPFGVGKRTEERESTGNHTGRDVRAGSFDPESKSHHRRVVRD